MAQPNGFMDEMMHSAMQEIARGDKGWKEFDPNTLTLAMCCYLKNVISEALVKPLYWLSGVMAAGILWSVVSDVWLD